MHARRALAAAFSVVLVLVLAACGDDGGSDATTTAADETTTTAEESTTTEATTTTETPLDDPQDIAEAVNLTIDDFPSDWTAEASDDDDDGLDVSECFVDSDLAGNTLAEADSDSFSQEQESGDTALVVGSTGIVTSGVGVASTVLGEATRAAFSDCVLGQFEDSLAGDGILVTYASLDYASGAPTDAEQVIALNGAIGLEDASGTTHEAELSMWLHRQGAVIAGVSVLDIGDTDFAGWVDTANEIVSERLVEVVG